MMRIKTLSLACLFILWFLPGTAPAGHELVAAGQDRIKETMILIPATEIKAVLGLEREGIFVTYDEYKRLYEKAKENYLHKEPKDFIPHDVEGPVVIQANYSGSVIGEHIEFEAGFKFVQNKKGPHIFDFPLTGVRYTGAKLNGEKVRIYQKKGVPRIILPDAGSHELVVAFLVPLVFTEKRGVGSFEIPPATLGNIKVTSDLFSEVKLNDLLFTSQRRVGDQKESYGFIGSKKAISIEITNRRSIGERAVKITSLERHQMFIERDIVHREGAFNLTVRDGEAADVDIDIGKHEYVYSLFGPGISGWSREDKGDKDVLHVTFHIPVDDKTRFTLKTYAYIEPGNGTIHLDDTRIKGLFERKGSLFVFYANNTQITTTEEEFIKPLEKPPIGVEPRGNYTLYRGYSLFNLPYRLTYTALAARSRLICHQTNHVSIEPSRIHFHSKSILQGLTPGNARINFSFPDNYELSDVKAFINGTMTKALHDLDKEKNRLTIETTNPVSAEDKVTFIFESERFLDENLLKKGGYKVTVPVATAQESRGMSGTLQLSIDEIFLLEDMKMKGYRPSEQMGNIPSDLSRDKTNLNYGFRTHSPEGTLTLSYRRGEMNSKTVSYVAVDQDLLQANAYIRYEISAGSRKSFYFALPRWENSKINITGTDIREKKKISFDKLKEKVSIPPLPVLKDCDIWNVLLQKDVTGTYVLAVDYQKKIEPAASFDVPLVTPVGVNNDTGYLIMEASRDTEIRIEKAGLNQVETYEIPQWPSYKPSNRIIESLRYFARPFTFRITVFRKKESPVLAAIVEKEDLCYTLGRDSNTFFQFDYLIRNTNLQFLEIRLPENYVLWSATLKGQGIKPRKGNDNTLLFPLASNDDTVGLRLTGYVPGAATGNILKHFNFQSPCLTIPSLQSQVKVFFPEDDVLFATTGNFENILGSYDQNPVVISFVQRLFASFYKNMKSISLFPSYRKSKTSRLEQAKPEEAPVFSHRREDADSEMERDRYGVSEPKDLKRSQKSPQRTMETPGTPAMKDSRKKGIYSMNINIPKEGALLQGGKLWGESRMDVTFFSAGWKRVLVVFTALIFVLLGSLLTKKKIMSPSGFVVVSLFIFTLLPLISFKPLVFIFDGAVLGALLFGILFWIMGLLRRSVVGARIVFALVFALPPFFFFAPHSAHAASGAPFPDIEVYVPYEETVPNEADEFHEVFIPTEDYFLLRSLAEPAYMPEAVFEYEDGYNITGFTLKGSVTGEFVRFRASLDIFVNHEEWALIDLPFSDVFIEKLTLDGKKIPVSANPENTKEVFPTGLKRDIYRVPVLGFGHHIIDLVFNVAIEATAGKKTISFGFPETLCSEFSLNMPERDVLLKFVDPEDGYTVEQTEEGLMAKASLSQRSFVKLSWFPKKFIKKAERPLIYAESQVNMFVDQGEVLLSQELKITIEKSSLASIAFQKHPELMIVDIFSDRVKSWHIGNKSNKTVLDVVFKNAVTESVSILIKAKMKVTPALPVPAVYLAPVEADRFRGYLDLYAPDDHNILVTKTIGLTKSDAREKRKVALQGFELQKSYSFNTTSFQADIVSRPRDRSVFAHIFSQYTFSEDILAVDLTVGLEVNKGFMTSVRLGIPHGFRVSSVHSEDMSDYHFQEDNVLVLSFRYAVRGKHRIELVIEKELSGLDVVHLEGIELLDIQDVTGVCLVLFPRGFDIREKKISQMWPIDIKTLPEKRRQVDETRYEARYAYRFREKPFKATFDALRKNPSVDVVKVYHARVEDDLVSVKVLSLLTIKNAPVDQIDILAPTQIRDAIKIEGDGIKNILKKTDEQGKNVQIAVHTVAGIEGAYLMEISFDAHFGKDRVFEMPHIVFPQANRVTEFISVESATVYHVETQVPATLQEVERETVPAFPAGINLNNILWTYRAAGTNDWHYRLELERLERVALIRAAITREDIKTLIIPQGYALHEISIKANNRVLQFLPLDFPVEAELWSLIVAGESVDAFIEKSPGDKEMKRLLVPLIKSSTGDRNFEIKLVYMTPVPEFGLWGKVDLGMVKTGDIPVEKTTWTLFVPESYAYPKFKNNMEEVDITVIEAEKTLDLAKEYEHWANLAGTVKGDLRQKAISNQEKVMTEYYRQQAQTRQMQSDLALRIKEKRAEDDRALLQDAQSQNVKVLDDALNIIESKKPASTSIERREEPPEKQIMSRRKNLKGWQFATRDPADKDDVQESVNNFVESEERKRGLQKKQVSPGPSIRSKGKREGVGKEVHKLATSRPATIGGAGVGEKIEGDKEIIQQQALPVKKSVLLKGLRSMDIPLPERGNRFSFTKLGGNPDMTLFYRKQGILSKSFYLFFLLAGIAGTLKFRNRRFPTEKVNKVLKGKGLTDFYHVLRQSRLVKAIPTFMIISAFFLGYPLFIMGLGLNSILLLRYLSAKRYEKKGMTPHVGHGYIVFVKYALSYVILASSFFCVITLFHDIFLLSLAVSTFFNCIYVVIYAVYFFLTKRKPVKEIDLPQSNQTL